MKTYYAVAAAFAAITLALAGAPAQGAEPWQTPPSSDRLLEDIKVLLEKGEREQLARRTIMEVKPASKNYLGMSKSYKRLWLIGIVKL